MADILVLRHLVTKLKNLGEGDDVESDLSKFWTKFDKESAKSLVKTMYTDKVVLVCIALALTTVYKLKENISLQHIVSAVLFPIVSSLHTLQRDKPTVIVVQQEQQNQQPIEAIEKIKSVVEGSRNLPPIPSIDSTTELPPPKIQEITPKVTLKN